MSDGRRVLIVGSGQLGTRHLQAVASLSEVGDIVVVDPSPASLELGRERLLETPDANPEIQYTWLTSLADAPAGDLAIIATRAAERPKIVEATVARGYRDFLVEKIVAQSVGEYQELLSFAGREGLRVWVNCKTRAYSPHRYIKSLIDSSAPLVLTDIGGNHGLANNGVHSADLFVFYDEATEIHLNGQAVEDTCEVTKRGAGIRDLAGTLMGISDKGSEFVLSFVGNHNSPDTVTITAPGQRFVVDHFAKQAWECREVDGWVWREIPIPADENWSVSHMTKAFASDIMAKGDCELPTLADCYPAHEFILSSLAPHFERLGVATGGVCPVT